jgi:hypothetical protein
MPRKRPPSPRHLPTPPPADRAQCPVCWTMRPVDDAGRMAAHQVRERYEGPARLIDCPGEGQEPTGQVVHSASPIRRF